MFVMHQNCKYYYPDGTVSVNRPNDGQIFYVWDLNSTVPTEIWQWNDSTINWVNITSGNIPDNTFDLVQEFERLVKLNEKKCECGSEAVGSTRHSNWCEKWSSSS